MNLRKGTISDLVKDIKDRTFDLDYDKWSMNALDYADKYSDTKQQINVGKASKLYKIMKDDSASDEDLFSVLCYALICIDAKKYHLDMNKAEDDFGFKSLQKKYGYITI